MSGPRGGNVRVGVLTAALFVAYAALSHYASVRPEAGPWAAVLALAPAAALGAGLLRRAAGLAATGLAAAAAVALLAWAWPFLSGHVPWLYFLQHVGVNAGLGLFFGRTLAAGRQPLCGVFASLMHETMTPGLLRYTRQVTVAWTLFFGAMTATSAALFFLAPAEAWSTFANLLTLPLVALMFVAENEVRKRVLPPGDQLGIAGALGGFRRAMALRRQARP